MGKQKIKSSRARTVDIVKGFRIREPRPGVFLLQVRRQGIHHCETFTSLEAARLKCEQLDKERVNAGMQAFELSNADRADANKALALLKGRSSLKDAVQFWCEHHPDGGTVAVKDLQTQYIADLVRRNCRPMSISGSRRRLTKFSNDLGDRPACTVTTPEIVEWLDARGGKPVNRDNFRRCIRAMFSFALEHGIVTINTADKVKRTETDEKMPEFWTAETVATMLHAAEMAWTENQERVANLNQKALQAGKPVRIVGHAGVVPVLAVMAFAGLRPDEAAHLQWQNVNLAERHIRVMPQTSKIRRARIVEMSPNLAAWLAPYRRDAGPLAPKTMTFRRWRQRVMKKAKLEHWPSDVLRHSYATHWLATHNDIAKLASLMGNSPDIILRNYRGLATEKEAHRYWAIKPARKDNVIRLSAVA